MSYIKILFTIIYYYDTYLRSDTDRRVSIRIVFSKVMIYH